MEGSATDEINSLNSSLYSLMYQLDTRALLNITRANISVEAAEDAIKEGFIVNNDTIVISRAANSALWGTFNHIGTFHLFYESHWLNRR